MLVQYEDTNRPPPLGSTWSWQDRQGSWALILLAYAGLVVGICSALYWAHLSVLGALASPQWPGYVWLALAAAGAALIAPVMWPFLTERRPQIASFVLSVGIVCWLVTSASGALYLMMRAEHDPASLANAPLASILAALKKDRSYVNHAEQDCNNGVWRGCDWLNSQDGHATRTRIGQYENERERRDQEPALEMTPVPVKIIQLFRKRLVMFATVALGGSIALALIWGPAEALKEMYSEPGTLGPGAALAGLEGFPGSPIGLENPIELAAESWARQCLERARGERVPVATLDAHYRGWCIQRGLPTFAGDAAFGRWLNRPREPGDPNDLGGPMVRFGAFPHKTGGRMEYIGVRILPDPILDDIEGENAT
jgi:hypothetical protein